MYRIVEDFAKEKISPNEHSVMGDSFTAGHSAEPGKSFVELIEAQFEAVVWNVAISGSGTTSFKEFAPLLKPQLSYLE